MTFPIVLAHGVCRFDVLSNKGLRLDNTEDRHLDRLHYFKGIRTMLRDRGFTAFHTNVSWAAGVQQCAQDLLMAIDTILEREGIEKVNIIAHSMGGLDTRHMLFHARNGRQIHQHIASVTTIATPHHGSPFADWCQQNLEPVPALLNRLGLDISAIDDLATHACRTFNENTEVREFEQIYQTEIPFKTLAGSQTSRGIFLPLKVPYKIIHKLEGDNDGLVSVSSAVWHKQYFDRTIHKADHLNELGWWDVSQLLNGEFSWQLYRRIHRLYLEIAESLP